MVLTDRNVQIKLKSKFNKYKLKRGLHKWLIIGYYILIAGNVRVTKNI
jgi:hypothetical protein